MEWQWTGEAHRLERLPKILRSDPHGKPERAPGSLGTGPSHRPGEWTGRLREVRNHGTFQVVKA